MTDKPLVRFIEGEPPEHVRRPKTTRHLIVARRLKEQPGVWAEVDMELAPSTFYNGEITAYRPGGTFEADRRNGVLYVRYVGKGQRDE